MLIKHFLAAVISAALIVITSGCDAVAIQESQGTQPAPIQPAQISPEHLQQLVAPIALYPDELVAQIRAMEAAGIKETVIEPPADFQREVYRDFAELVMPAFR
jgi:hypothetical protein